MALDLKMINSEQVIKQLIGRGIEWFDYHKLDKAKQQEYKTDANFIVNSEIFLNELNHYITDLIKFIAYESNDFNQVLHTRTSIVALETFKQRLQNIEDPKKDETSEQPFEAI